MAEPKKHRFVVFDARGGRKAKSAVVRERINVLRPFMADYLDNFNGWNFESVVGQDDVDDDEAYALSMGNLSEARLKGQLLKA